MSDTGQGGLFDGIAAEDPVMPDSPLPDIPELSKTDILMSEKELLGIYLTEHPLAQYVQGYGDARNLMWETAQDAQAIMDSAGAELDLLGAPEVAKLQERRMKAMLEFWCHLDNSDDTVTIRAL